MFKKLFLAAMILFLPTVILTGCGDDGPDDPTPEYPDKPSTPDQPDNPDSPNDKPNEQGNKKVVINADGTTSDGSFFRRIDETTFMLNYVEYKILDGHIEVTGRDDTEIGLSLNGHVEIYSVIVIDNISYYVRVIDYQAFEGCKSLKTIILPNTVTAIRNGEYSDYDRAAFKGCESLKEIILPNTLTTIGNYAFEDCKSLEEIILPNTLTTIGSYTFSGCESLKEIILPNTLTTIGLGAFKSCISLTRIDIPGSVSTILGHAFRGCTSLTHVNLPEGVKEIGVNAFGDCENLVSICLPASIESFNYKFDDGRDKNYLSYLKYIYFKSVIPPRMKPMFFGGSDKTPTAFVPEESYNDYNYPPYEHNESGVAYLHVMGVDTKTFDFEKYVKEQEVK